METLEQSWSHCTLPPNDAFSGSLKLKRINEWLDCDVPAYFITVMIIIGAEQQLCPSSCTMHVCVVKVAYVTAQ